MADLALRSSAATRSISEGGADWPTLGQEMTWARLAGYLMDRAKPSPSAGTGGDSGGGPPRRARGQGSTLSVLTAHTEKLGPAPGSSGPIIFVLLQSES